MESAIERIDATYTDDTPTYSIAIVSMSSSSVVFSEIDEPQPSTTTTIGFFTRDPIGYEGSQWGLYELLNGQVIDSNDPLGLASIDCKCHCGGGPGPQGEPVKITTNCDGKDGEACCHKACHTKMSFCVYRSLPGDNGGVSGTILVPADFVNNAFKCDDPDRCFLRIQHLNCG